MSNSILQMQRYSMEWDIMFSYFYEPKKFQSIYPLSEQFFEDHRIAYIFKKTQEAIAGGYVDNMPRRLEELMQNPKFRISEVVEDWIKSDSYKMFTHSEYIDNCKTIAKLNLYKKLQLQIEKSATPEELTELIRDYNERDSIIQSRFTTGDMFEKYFVGYATRTHTGWVKQIVTFWDRLDDCLQLQKKHLMVLGARPSIGKSAWALNFALNAARANHKVLFISIEMDEEQMLDRLCALLVGVDSKKIAGGVVDVEEIKKTAINLIKGDSLIIKYSPRLTSSDLFTLVKTLGKFDLVVIDYLQLLKDPLNSNLTEAQRIGKITGNLKMLAGEQDCAVLALSQLNRENEKMKRKPVLSDLRDSGCIEQDADIVALLHREDRTAKVAFVDIAKNRHGSCESIPFSFDPPTTKFTEISEKIQASWEGEP